MITLIPNVMFLVKESINTFPEYDGPLLYIQDKQIQDGRRQNHELRDIYIHIKSGELPRMILCEHKVYEFIWMRKLSGGP